MLDDRALPDQDGAAEHGALVDPGVVGKPLAAAALGGVDGQVQASLEQVELGGQVGDRGAEVAPVAVQLVAVHGRARGQQRREQVALERRRPAGRNVVQH